MPTTTELLTCLKLDARTCGTQPTIADYCICAQFEDLVNTGEKTTIWCATSSVPPTDQPTCRAAASLQHSQACCQLRSLLCCFLDRHCSRRPACNRWRVAEPLHAKSVLTRTESALQGFVFTWEMRRAAWDDRVHEEVMTTAASAICLRIAISCVVWRSVLCAVALCVVRKSAG